MTVREALPADYPALAELEKEIFELHFAARPDVFRYRETPLTPELFAKWTDGEHILLVAEEDGTVIGQAVALVRTLCDHPVFRDREWLEIDDISVRADFRGRGVGTALFRAVLEQARRRKLSHIELTVWGFNQRAHGFYEKLGMRSRIDRMELDLPSD